MAPAWRLALALLLLAPPSAAGARDPSWARGWAESVVGQGVTAGRASAASVAVVEGGRVAYVAGYGRVRPGGPPVDSATTRFKIASITKTFTGLAVAQLSEQGRIGSLDDPASRYLRRARLPTWEGRPITLRQLLTHGAGFEERGSSWFQFGRTSIPADGAYIERAIPALVRPLGSAIVYANIDPPLVAAAVEDITGERFDAHLARTLFAPLGMRSTRLSYAQRPEADLVVPFVRTGNTVAALRNDANAPFFAPTGSVETTAADMARFLNAMLGHAPAALPPATVARALRPLASNGPGLDALGHYWFLSRWGKVRIAEHAGALTGVGAWVIIVPDADVAMFVAWAGGEPPFDFDRLHDSFLLAALGPHGERVAPANADFTALEGAYRSERRPQRNAEALLGLGGPVTSVHAAPGGIEVDGKRLYPTGDGSFAEPTDGTRAPMRVRFDHGVMRERVDVAPRVSGLADPRVQGALAGMFLLLAASGLAAPAWRLGRVRWAAVAVAVAALAIPAAVGVIGLDGIVAELQRGQLRFFHLLQVATVVLGVGAVAIGAASFRARRDRRFARWYAPLVALGAGGAAVLFTALHVFEVAVL